MIDGFEKLVARDPQRSDSSRDNDRGRNNGRQGQGSQRGANADGSPSSFVSVVFVTASPTFTGRVAGFTTLGFQPSETPGALVESSPSTPSADQVVPIPESEAPPAALSVSRPRTQPQPEDSQQIATDAPPPPSESSADDLTSAVPSSAVPTSVDVISSLVPLDTSDSEQLTATSSLSTAQSSIPAEGATEPTAAPPSDPSATGMSSGAKAGLGIGIVGIVCLLAGVALWLYRKKQKGSEGYLNADDEKAAGLGGAGTALGANRQGRKSALFGGAEAGTNRAPHLSLRPVTQFLPDFAGGKKRVSQGNALGVNNPPANMAAAGADRSLTHGDVTEAAGSQGQRSGSNGNASNPFTDPVNPFGDQPRTPSQQTNPNVTVTPPGSSDSSSMAPSDTGVAGSAGEAVGAGAVAAGAGAGAGAAVAAGAVKAGNGQAESGPGSPEGLRGGSSGPGLAGVSAGSPPIAYRVQLAFHPSMDDELELRAGELIRILHEYDDGWALCIRLDRSRQGVAPRTCLSARPAKFRPTNGPPRTGPNRRPIGAAQHRPMNSNGGSPPPHSSASSLGPSRPGTSHSNRAAAAPTAAQQPMPPMPKQQPQQEQLPSLGEFNQAPRPLSPGPVARMSASQRPKRSQSPGPYGADRGPTPMMPMQRRRSNSTSAVLAKRSSNPIQDDPTVGWRSPQAQDQPSPNRETAPGVAI